MSVRFFSHSKVSSQSRTDCSNERRGGRERKLDASSSNEESGSVCVIVLLFTSDLHSPIKIRRSVLAEYFPDFGTVQVDLIALDKPLHVAEVL